MKFGKKTERVQDADIGYNYFYVGDNDAHSTVQLLYSNVDIQNIMRYVLRIANIGTLQTD